MAKHTRSFSLIRTARKFAVSAFVVFSFGAYAVHEHFGRQDGAAALGLATQPAAAQQFPTAPAPTQSLPATAAPTTEALTSTDTAQAATDAPTAPAPTDVPTAPAPTDVPTAPAPTEVPTAPQVTQAAPSPTTPVVANGLYKDGQYTGNVANAYFGDVQVQATI